MLNKNRNPNHKLPFKDRLANLYGLEHKVSDVTPEERNQFISKVYRLFVLSLIVAGLGAYVGVQMGLGYKYYWLLFIIELLILIVTIVHRKAEPYNLLLLFTFTGFSGFTTSPMLNHIIAAGKGELITYAFLLSVALFTILSAYVHITKKDFSWMGGFLFTALIILIFAMIAGLLLPGLFNWIILCSISLLLFSGFVLYDTSLIILKHDVDEYVSATLDLYLDFINIFVDILRILFETSADVAEKVGDVVGDIDIDVDV